jgi:hypothetical protein
MSMEADLVTLLKTVCPRVFPDVAPANTAKPFVTWQPLGGESLRFLNNEAPDKRNTYLQVSVYSTTRLESLNLIRAAEEALCKPGIRRQATGRAHCHLRGRHNPLRRDPALLDLGE